MRDQHRNILTINLFFSSWVVIFLSVGMVVEEWVHLNTADRPTSHSPWKNYFGAWQEENIKYVMFMMATILSLAFFHNFFLGLGITYMIPHKEHFCFISIALSFFTGIFLLITLLVYHYNIKQGNHKYYSSYKFTWITFINCLNVFILSISGILSLLIYSSKSLFLNTIHLASEQSLREEEARDSPTTNSLPANPMPRSIVHRPSTDPHEQRPNEPARRVTWAFD